MPQVIPTASPLIHYENDLVQGIESIIIEGNPDACPYPIRSPRLDAVFGILA